MEKIFKMVMLIGILITFLALALPAIGMAEEEVNQEKKTLELNKMVVTATRMEKDVDSAPGNVTVVSKEDMKFRDIHTIDDVLKFESGIYNGQLRGTPNEAHTLVVVNGKPLNTGWYGHVRWDNIAIGDVERIEIIRGPASALYGGNAMGGVINIITSTPKKFEAGVAVGYGSDDTSRYSLHVGDRFADKLSLRVGYEFEETDGYPTSLVRRNIKSGSGTLTGGYETLDTSGRKRWVVGDYGDSREKRWNVNLNAVYDLTDTGSLAFDFQTGHTEAAKGRPHTYLRDASGNPTFTGSVDAGNGKKATVSPPDYLTSGIQEIETPSYMLTYRESFGSIDFIGKVGYQKEDYWKTSDQAEGSENYDNAPGYLKEYYSNAWFSDMQTNIPIGDNHILIAGLYYRYDDFDQGRFELAYYRDENSITTPKTEITLGTDRFYAAYLQDEWQLTDKLTLFTGARFDCWEAFDGRSGIVGDEVDLDDRDDYAISPKLSVVWKPVANTIIKGSAGGAFRPPTLYDLFRTYRKGNGGMVYSNPDINPETLWNYEIGVNQYFFNRALKISATCFHTDIEDLIYSYRIDDDSYKDNAGEARINGIEFEASVRPFDWLNLWGNYTYNDSKIEKNDHDPEMEGKTITGMPVRTINLGTEISYKWIAASLRGRYLGRIYTNKYNTDIDGVYGGHSRCWLWETKITVSPWKHAEVSFVVENLFDKEYFSSIGRERNYFAEVRLKW